MHVLEYLFQLIKKLVLIQSLLDVSLIRYALYGYSDNKDA